MSNKESEAALWKPAPGGAVRCRLCAHYCRLGEGEFGRCAVRLNRGGRLVSKTAAALAALNLDPVEKKPLFHFLPGSMTFSAGSLGCNFSCLFCQNSEISQYSTRWPFMARPASSASLVEAALQHGAQSISYTYNEPTVFFELMSASAALARGQGLRNIMVSNAYLSRETLDALDGLVDAANFDLKAFSDSFYRDYCGARLKPVLQTLCRAVKAGWWVEITTLIITGLNDGEDELDNLAAFIAGELGSDVPWHVSRFRPAYKMPDRPPSAMDSLERALEAGRRRGLRYVYAGNVAGHDAESTYCPQCKKKLISRRGFSVKPGLTALCSLCGLRLPGVWE